MCGIVGIASKNDCIDNILSGLYSLEYRGYDSSGLATIKNNHFEYNKNIGKISNLEKSVKNNKLIGRGANDMKASIACFIAAVSKIESNKLKGIDCLNFQQNNLLCF